MPAQPAPFVTAYDGEVTATELYRQCRRDGGLSVNRLRDVSDWPRLVAALRRLAARDGLSLSTATERERSWPRRVLSTRAQVHKDGVLAYLPDAG